MNDQIDNPLIPDRMEILIFWALTLGFFVGWSVICGFIGYIIGNGG